MSPDHTYEPAGGDRASETRPGAYPVPWPRQTTITEVIREGAILDDEQQTRVCDWLQANGIDPDTVVRGGITIVQPGRGTPVICFRQYDIGPDGGKYVDPLAGDMSAATYERHIPMSVPLPPQPLSVRQAPPHTAESPDAVDGNPA